MQIDERFIFDISLLKHQSAIEVFATKYRVRDPSCILDRIILSLLLMHTVDKLHSFIFS